MAAFSVLTWKWACEIPVGLGDPISLTITNNQYCSNHKLVFAGDSYFFKNEIPFNGTSATIQLVAMAGKRFSDIKPIRLSLQTSNGKEVASIQPHFLGYHFTKDLFQNKDREKANVFVFGMAGSGKSTFVNSAYTILSPDDRLLHVALEGGTSDHVTCRFNAYNLALIENSTPKDALRYRLLDSWGLDRQNYCNNQFQMILKGQLPPGFEMNENALRLKFDPGAMKSRSVHSVIFFLPIGEFATDNPTPMVQKTASFMKEATKMEINSFVAISLVDTLYRDFPTSGPSPVKEIERAMKHLAVGEGRIFPVVSLTKRTRDFVVEMKLLDLIFDAAHCAGDRVDLVGPPNLPKSGINIFGF